MKNIIIISILIFTNIVAFSQTPTVDVIRPGSTYTNDHSFKVFYMPKSKVIKFLNLQTKLEIDSIRISQYKELTSNYEHRTLLADSTCQLKQLEADYWHSKLLTNDAAFEKQRILNIKLIDEKDRIRRSRLYYFAAGVVAASIVVVAMK